MNINPAHILQQLSSQVGKQQLQYWLIIIVKQVNDDESTISQSKID